MGAELLIAVLPAWLEGTLEATAQPRKGATLTHLLRREDGRLDPSRPAIELERQVRAYQPWPGSFLEHEEGRLKVWAASVLGQRVAVEPGTVILTEGTLGLGTIDGVLRLDEVQPAGKRRMSGAEYRRGRRL
jgi:methionyl-tRNA formyltransferase